MSYKSIDKKTPNAIIFIYECTCSALKNVNLIKSVFVFLKLFYRFVKKLRKRVIKKTMSTIRERHLRVKDLIIRSKMRLKKKKKALADEQAKLQRLRFEMNDIESKLKH